MTDGQNEGSVLRLSGDDVAPERFDIVWIEHIVPRRHIALPVGHGIDKTCVGVARKVPQIGAHCGLRIRVPWQVAQWCANSAAPFLICSGVNCGSPSCAAALAHTNARPR